VRVLLIVAVATICFAATESRVSRASILAVERSINDKFTSDSTDPYYLLGDARGTYLEGYGTLFTTELNLVNTAVFNPNPFQPTITPQQIAQAHDRKLKKLTQLKDTMRALMMDASATLEGMPPNEKVAMEARLFSYSWENTRGMPHRLFMSAEKQKLLAAKAAHASPADVANIIEEQER
jgi:hypothetical protein